MLMAAWKWGPALAAGCTVVLKPSEIAPADASIFAEVLHEAGVPAGVFNLVHGDGPGVGSAISAHPDIDMVSFTGSTRAGILVAKSAADSVKRVAQELGGKSAMIICEDADLEQAAFAGVVNFTNQCGQGCVLQTRQLVHNSIKDQYIEMLKAMASQVKLGDPADPDTGSSECGRVPG